MSSLNLILMIPCSRQHNGIPSFGVAGPVTFVFPAQPTTPRWLTGRFDSLAVRVTDHPLVVELCLAFGKPLVSTSANLTGQPPCRSTEEVLAQFGNDFPVAVGETGGRLNPSEIRDALTGERFAG